MRDPTAEAALFVDFDHTDGRLRIWRGAELVGEMRPNVAATPIAQANMRDMRWTGWLSADALTEIMATYSAAAVVGANRMAVSAQGSASNG